jgi:serine/threonine protein kinase
VVVPVTVGSIVGPYRLEALLGEGGMGAVYRAEHILLKRTVALKVLHASMTNQHEVTQRFLNEAVAVSILESEHIVKVVDCQQDPRLGVWWIAMEYLHGRTLSRYLVAQGTPLPLEVACRIFSQVAEALDEAHAQGIVHRDIKPDNIFLVERGHSIEVVKVLDFGIAKLRSHDVGVVTRDGASLGTTPYMAPEQIRGLAVDHRVDVFALAVVIFGALSFGRHPFQFSETTAEFRQMTVTEMCLRQLSYKPVDIRHWNPAIPDAVAMVLERGLDRERDLRPYSAGELIVALARAGGALGEVERYSKLLVPHAARRSIQASVHEAPPEPTPPEPVPLEPAPPEPATVRVSDAVPLLIGTPPRGVSSSDTTLRGTAAEAARSTRSTSIPPPPPPSRPARIVRVAGVAVALLAIAGSSALVVTFAVKQVVPAQKRGAASRVIDAGVSDAAPADSRNRDAAEVPVDAPRDDSGSAMAAAPTPEPNVELRRVKPAKRVPRGQLDEKPSYKKRTGTLDVTAGPVYPTEVHVDGRREGTTPKILPLPAGQHVVTLTSPTGQVERFKVWVHSNRTTPIHHTWKNEP